ncbi:MAG: YeeE/YedE thiosulfate transporter family protein [Candidatus Omnitrophota bacterium]|nr:YeeE/YedE family protein [Candidatus Omnitrophota bacterium]MBU1928305.1 YeeE/YedE family protein [Candidatus Omnitrophota bacterium]MBU2035539.1 YeeE/YedE family protein [Candidatus Omnitrophota bacterium]MBU2257489.1 YeeE/YedE family protein [Candidatus Omnitrophota bacterium]
MLKKLFSNFKLMAAGFALLNVIMYLSIKKFWIGGSSFLPMIGTFGPNNAFVFAFIVNLGVIAGALLGAVIFGEFILRLPKARDIGLAILSGTLIGIGVTLAPGTCTTVFVTGMPMLSVNAFLSAAGIFIGAFLTYAIFTKNISQ